MSSNVALVDSANGALYGCFCVVGFFAGSIVNKIGIRPCLTVRKLEFRGKITVSLNPALLFLSLGQLIGLCFVFRLFMGVRS
jgi:hypothetical protein